MAYPKGKPQSEESNRKRSEALKGKKKPPRSKEWREKQSKSKKGQHFSPDTELKKGYKPPWTGKKRKNVSGEKHWNWQGGLGKDKKHRAFLQRQRENRKKRNGGSHTLGEWENLKAQFNWTCPMCGRSEPEIKLTEDHIIPLSRGGSNNIENIQPLCQSCNSKKHTKIISFRE